jgi:hypothetical protein
MGRKKAVAELEISQERREDLLAEIEKLRQQFRALDQRERAARTGNSIGSGPELRAQFAVIRTARLELLGRWHAVWSALEAPAEEAE